jgi:beta-glucosidase
MVMIPNAPGQKNSYVDFINDLAELVAEGKVPQSRIDDAVTRILRVKFAMGLFGKSGVDPKLTVAVGSAAHRAVARECVRQSLVLLKNANHALPLSKTLKHLHVMGKAADDLGIQCGGWTISWQGEAGQKIRGATSILTGVRNAVASGADVTYSASGENSPGADAVLVVVGELPYAETKGDRETLSLSEKDRALISKAKETGAPVITVVISGRPLILGDAINMSDALVAAWLPGSEGQGVADVLFGDYKPTGKLSRAWPLNNEQITTPSADEKPIFPYGFGLTY